VHERGFIRAQFRGLQALIIHRQEQRSSRELQLQQTAYAAVSKNILLIKSLLKPAKVF